MKNTIFFLLGLTTFNLLSGQSLSLQLVKKGKPSKVFQVDPNILCSVQYDDSIVLDKVQPQLIPWHFENYCLLKPLSDSMVIIQIDTCTRKCRKQRKSAIKAIKKNIRYSDYEKDSAFNNLRYNFKKEIHINQLKTVKLEGLHPKFTQNAIDISGSLSVAGFLLATYDVPSEILATVAIAQSVGIISALIMESKKFKMKKWELQAF
ncbi:MAG: hypothetical protein MRY83_11325 [Flavobacteriales bacterium]|nr:hypothetical protein [Flavobacteriales bacterium]